MADLVMFVTGVVMWIFGSKAGTWKAEYCEKFYEILGTKVTIIKYSGVVMAVCFGLILVLDVLQFLGF